MLVLTERSCNKEYTYLILKPYLRLKVKVKVKFTLDRRTDRQTGWFLYTPQTSFAGGILIIPFETIWHLLEVYFLTLKKGKLRAFFPFLESLAILQIFFFLKCRWPHCQYRTFLVPPPSVYRGPGDFPFPSPSLSRPASPSLPASPGRRVWTMWSWVETSGVSDEVGSTREGRWSREYAACLAQGSTQTDCHLQHSSLVNPFGSNIQRQSSIQYEFI